LRPCSICTNKDKSEAPRLAEEFCSLVAEEKYALYPGAKELLQFFRQKGCRIYVTSASGTGAMIKRIYELGMLPWVDFLLGSDVYKKSPKHIEMLAEKEMLPLGDFVRQAVYFGDGPGDMRIAQTVGIFTVGVAQTVVPEKLYAAGADLVIGRIGEALELDFGGLEKRMV
jgi:phosphoglycolate phosphatase